MIKYLHPTSLNNDSMSILMAKFAMQLVVLMSLFSLGQENSTKTGVDIARQTFALRIGVCWTKTHS